MRTALASRGWIAIFVQPAGSPHSLRVQMFWSKKIVPWRSPFGWLAVSCTRIRWAGRTPVSLMYMDS